MTRRASVAPSPAAALDLNQLKPALLQREADFFCDPAATLAAGVAAIREREGFTS